MPDSSPPDFGWTDTEHAELSRIGSGWTLEQGQVHAGDPWCTIRDNTMVLAHLARVGQVYVVYWPGRQQSLRTISISTAVDLVLAGR